MKEDVIVAEIDGEGMMINVEMGTSHFLNETALFIYKMLKENKNEEEIKDALLKEYDIDTETVEKDIREFQSQIKNKMMIP